MLGVFHEHTPHHPRPLRSHIPADTRDEITAVGLVNLPTAQPESRGHLLHVLGHGGLDVSHPSESCPHECPHPVLIVACLDVGSPIGIAGSPRVSGQSHHAGSHLVNSIRMLLTDN